MLVYYNVSLPIHPNYISILGNINAPSLVYIEHTPFCIGPVPVPLYLLTIQISLYSLFLYLSFSLLSSVVSRQHYLWLDSRFQEGAGSQNLGELQQKFIAKKQEHSQALISVCWWAVDESRDIQAQHILQSHWLQTPSFGSNHDMFVTTCTSMSGSTSYQLTISRFGNASCSCPNFYSQGGACKHLRAFHYVINAWTEKPFHYPQTLASAQEIAHQTMSSKTSNLMAVVPESQLSPEPIDWAVIQALGGDSTILGNGLDEQGDTDSEAIVESPATSLDSDEDPLMDLNLFQHSAIGIQISQRIHQEVTTLLPRLYS
ncbi:hypothetical protein GG344DRAFT_80872 [Lentinula edodes]|nr:hypothetical protein GG344DRAFT_80872 [Lentinula edodes]